MKNLQASNLKYLIIYNQLNEMLKQVQHDDVDSSSR